MSAERPFRDALVELTLEANDQQLDPFEAYIRLRQKMGRVGLYAHDYCSSSITSGGHARDTSLTTGDVIRKNTDVAMDLSDELFKVGQLNPRTTVEAVVLGKIAWKQSDYMNFWLSTMAGLPARGYGVAKAIDNFQKDFQASIDHNENLDMAIYDSSQQAKVRASHYFEHAQTFARTVRQHSHEPIKRLVRLVDTDTSLGAQSEKVFARTMQIGIFGVALAQTGAPHYSAGLPASLILDTERIVAFGGTVFDETRREQPILVHCPVE